jgi:hypothetical protein
MTGDSLAIRGSSLFEILELIVVKPGSEGGAEWYYYKDLGRDLRGSAGLRAFECDPDIQRFVP